MFPSGRHFIPSSSPRYDALGYPIDRYGRTAVLSEEPIDINTGCPVGPSLPRCENVDCHGCLLWVYDDVDTRYRVCGFCGDMERFDRSGIGNFITVAEASAAKNCYRLQLAGAETAAEVAEAKMVLRVVKKALEDSISKRIRSLERSYFKRYLLNYARWENEGFHWHYCPSMSSAQRAAYDAKRFRVNKSMLDAHWSVVLKEIVDKIEGIKMMQEILGDIQFLGI
ncbi:hypothetical protein Q9L58_009777 [Maublancomyces gigas]|uniref:Uncharacterized protein n=1 Tax=Discina gigas TaxID=1032678 RepID=A0ABR3G624_9PEZI